MRTNRKNFNLSEFGLNSAQFWAWRWGLDPKTWVEMKKDGLKIGGISVSLAY